MLENPVKTNTKNTKKETSLRSSLVLWFLVISLLPLSIVAWVGYQQANERLTTAAIDKLMQSARLNQKFIQVWFQYRLMDINFQAENSNNAEVLMSLEKGWKKSNKTLKKYIKSVQWTQFSQDGGTDLVAMSRRYDYIYDIFLIDTEGNILYSVTRESDLGTNLISGVYANTNFAKTVKETLKTGKTIISDLERYEPSGNRVAGFITAPILDESGNKVGVIAVQIEANRIVEVLRQKNEDGGSLVHYIVGEDGKLRTTMLKENSYRDVLKREINTEQFSSWHTEKDDLPRGVAEQESEEEAFIYIGPNGKPVIGIHNDLELVGLNWVLISEINLNEALKSANWFAKLILMMLILTIIVVIAMAVFQARRITKPIDALMNASRLVADGETDQKVEITANNEIGKLAEAFNHMLVMRQIHAQTLEETNTKTKAALAELDEQRFALDQHSIVAMTDIKGNITFVNEKFTQISGYSEDELLGKNHRLLNSGYHDKAFFVNMYKTIASGKVWHGEVCNRAKDGALYWVGTTIVPFMGEDNKPVTYIAIRTDITAQKTIEAELTDALETAQIATQLKSDFLANMSHEIRTPMNGVIGMTGLLLDTELTSKQRDYAENTMKSADALLTIINDILDFSKIEAGKLELEIVPFDLRELAEDVAELMALKCREKNIEMLLRYKPGSRRLFFGDPGRIRQVLLNFLSNAVKFTEKGQVLLSIECFGGLDDSATLLVKVEDSGIGIEQDKLEKIFNKFDQEDGSTTRKFGGTGLGLAICRELCGMMRGGIVVKSEKGKGSVFSFTMALDIDHQADNENGEALELHLEADAGVLVGAKILVVDDLPISRQILAEQLLHDDIALETAETAYVGLEKIITAIEDNAPFDIVIIDADMPVMDGATLAVQIKERKLMEAGALIYVTSVSQKNDAERLLKLGFDAYLTKPVRPSEVRQIVTLVWDAKLKKQHLNYLISRHNLRSNITGTHSKIKLINAHILLAEDNPINQMVATEYLEGYGCSITPAGNGLEALQQIETQNFDLVFMDCQMPEMDGFEATNEIRKRKVKSRSLAENALPIIAFTANAMQSDKEKCLAAGMDDFISKPVSQQALEDILTKWLPHKLASTEDDVIDAVTHSDEPVLDESSNLDFQAFNALKELFGDTFSEVVRKHAESTLNNISAIQGFIDSPEDQRDFVVLERAAHSIKGASAQFGAIALSEIAAEIELQAENKNVEKVTVGLVALKKEQKKTAAVMEKNV